MYRFPDGKVYIGQTRRMPEIRKREHTDNNVGPTSSGFWEAYSRYDGEYEYKVLYEIEHEEEDELVAELNYYESLYIHLYKSDNPEFGYNKRSFGTVATKTNAIIDRRFHEIAALYKERTLKVYNSAIKKIWETKKSLTPEEKYLLTEKYRSQNIWQKQIDEYDFDDFSKYDESDLEFLIDEYLHYVRILLIQEAEENARQYIKDNFEQILREEKDKNAIVQIDKEGNIVREFYSTNEICQALHILKAVNVQNVLKGKQKTAYGFYWKYKRDINT
jgi:hypothetical protein